MSQLGDIFKLQTKHYLAGVTDSCQFNTAFRQIIEDKRIQANVIRASVLQVVLLISVFTLDFLIAPSLSRKGLELEHAANVSFYYQLIWLYPLLGLSFFSAGSAYSKLGPAEIHGHSQSSASAGSFVVKAFEGLSRALVIVQAFVISFLLYRIPIIGSTICFFYMSIINAYYCFEYLWIGRSWTLRDRANFLECRWAYFAGFGLLSTCISFFHPSPILNLTLFSLIFPINLLQASNARPLPASNTADDLLGTSSRPSTDSEKQPLWHRLPVLWFAVQLNDLLSHPTVKRAILGRMRSGSYSAKKSSAPSSYTQTYSQANPPYPSWRPPQQPSAAPSAPAFNYVPSAAKDEGGQGQPHSISTRPTYLNTVAGSSGVEQRRRPAAKAD